jgi:ADP-ribosyl-[dinitrogen reductase] hydrolase
MMKKTDKTRSSMLLTPQDRYAGCLLGLAVGDALGAPVEFQPPGSFAPLTDMIAGGPFNLQRGQYTDDTTMALCLAESLLEKGGFDPVDQLERYVRWYRQGYLSSTGACFDIGNTTRAALEDFERSGQPYRAEGGLPASNGAIMRLAPVALAFANRPAEAVRLCGDSARTTHNFIEAVETCRLLGALMVGALAGEPKERLLAPGYAPAPGLWQSQPFSARVQAISQGAYRQRQPPEIRGGGQAAESLEAALWAFYHSQGFEDGLLLAVNLGDDADTTGAVYGQLAGAYYGLPAIPDRWLEALWSRPLIEATALKLCAFAGEM